MRPGIFEQRHAGVGELRQWLEGQRPHSALQDLADDLVKKRERLDESGGDWLGL